MFRRRAARRRTDSTAPSAAARSTTTVSADDVIEAARRLVASGTPRAEAAAQLAATANRDALDEAHVRWLRRMHRLPYDDPEATPVLRVILTALEHHPRVPDIVSAR